ncbi:MAG: hypothetical protein KDD70_08540 [Bdellovibrionales bacterium]|nr:hypothetical protein [Bdellovibrionales bacterium]
MQRIENHCKPLEALIDTLKGGERRPTVLEFNPILYAESDQFVDYVRTVGDRLSPRDLGRAIPELLDAASTRDRIGRGKLAVELLVGMADPSTVVSDGNGFKGNLLSIAERAVAQLPTPACWIKLEPKARDEEIAPSEVPAEDALSRSVSHGTWH